MSDSAGPSRKRSSSVSSSSSGGGADGANAGTKRKARPEAADAVAAAAKKPKSALKKSASSTSMASASGSGSGSRSAAARSTGAQTTLKLAPSYHAGKYGAALTSCSGFDIPQSISFAADVVNAARGSTSKNGARSRPGEEAALYVSGQDDVMFYHNTNWRPQPLTAEGKRPPADKGYSGQYLIGVHDPQTNTITLHRAPLFTMTRLISSLQNLNAIKADTLGQSADWSARVAARRDLGDVFGTRKAKATVRAQDRLKVDASHMAAMLDEVAEGINESASILPSVQDISQVEAEGRPGPVPNLLATRPEDVYPPSILVPAAVLSSLPINRLLNSEDEESMRKILPSPGPGRSDWLCSRLWALVKRVKANSSHGEGGILRTTREESRTKLRLAFYLALLWAFRNNRSLLDDRATLMGRLRIDGANNGEAIADDLISRFAEMPRGGGKPHITTLSETRIFTHICALALHLDDFAVSSTDLAHALALPTAKMTDYFKSIGCVSSEVNVPIAAPSSNALENTASASLRKERRLVLKIPLKFPENKRRAPPKAR
ncbi:DNA-directed RNA polymerase I subunit rpa49 [Tilletia horrida]|nr:DNA-directed RNA polymerase I subunit rpa49 [Tilletia horrida]